jgi:hypothetical protein
MAYADFTLERLLTDFNISLSTENLFPNLVPVAVPQRLIERLEEGQSLALVSEKARSEFIVAPVLLAVRQLADNRLSIYSGQRLDIDLTQGLAGECDFILAETPPFPILRAPIISVVEAKKADIDIGLGQCAAQMLGSLRFNQRTGADIRTVFGCVTNSRDWQFLRLTETTLTYDAELYSIHESGLLLACFLAAFRMAHETVTATVATENATRPLAIG